jgi:hypothetical protein
MIVVALALRHPGYYRCRDLGHDVWNSDNRNADPDNGCVQRHISTVRTLLAPLGVTVASEKDVGYLLTELPDGPWKRKKRRRKAR